MAALGYGISDFVGGIASRRVAALRVVVISYPVALILLTLLAIPVGGVVSTPAVVWGLISGVAQAFGVWWFYAALGAGPISVVSPLTAILVAGIPVGVGLALGERPGPLAIVGVVVALAAVVLVSRKTTDEDVRPHKFTAKVAWLTVGSGV
ncbi:MAG: EamA family transporter, partial [Mycobacterium sp.]